MKGKQILCALLCVLALTNAVPAARAAEVQAGVAAGKVVINGRAIDNSSAEYPLLVYRDITYFPMTFHLCRFLGLTTEWDALSRTLTITRTGGAGDYVPDTGHSGRSGSVSATRVDYPVVVNDEGIDNSAAKYPLLNYGGVTYFPLTWAFAVDSFGWDYRWDAENGLRIDSSGGTPYVTPPIVNPANPPISTGELSEAEIINGIMRAWSPSVWSSSPASLTVDLTGEWSLEAVREAIGEALREHVRDTDRTLTDVAISYTFQLPANPRAGDVLTVPYTASYEGAPVLLPSGRTFTPSGSAEEATASVRLGPGWAGRPDAGFQAGRELYQKLEACTRIPILTAVSGSEGYYDLSPAILEAVNANLQAAGLPYRVGSMSTGSYVNPYWTKPGYSQDIQFTVSFSPTDENAPADRGLEITAGCVLLTVEK